MDVVGVLLAVVFFYIGSGFLSGALDRSKENPMNLMYVVGGIVSLVVGACVVFAFLKANGFQ
jgi:hypothetical protein